MLYYRVGIKTVPSYFLFEKRITKYLAFTRVRIVPNLPITFPKLLMKI